MQTKTLSERIAEIQRASQLETFGFKTDPRNETAEKIILEFLKSQKWVAQKSIEIIEELQAENQALLSKVKELERKVKMERESGIKAAYDYLVFVAINQRVTNGNDLLDVEELAENMLSYFKIKGE